MVSPTTPKMKKAVIVAFDIIAYVRPVGQGQVCI